MIPHRIASLSLVLALGVAASAAGEELTPPWIGYDVGTSAYPGNEEAFERDPTAIATADFNGDGLLDVAVSNYEYAAPGGGTDGMSGFALIFNQGDGTYGPPVHTTVSSLGCWDIVAADFDEDGDPDVAVSICDTFHETGQTARVYWNDGAGAFPTFRTLVVGQGPIGLAAGDFDGDGDLDLAAANHRPYQEQSSVSILLGNGAGNFAGAATYMVSRRARKLEAGDLNGDQRDDLVVAHDWQEVSVLLAQPGGTFGPPVAYGQLFVYHDAMLHASVALADTDRDGDLDVFYGNTDSGPYMGLDQIVHFANDGAGSLVRRPDIPLLAYDSGPSDLGTADFNGDGWTDVVSVNFTGRATDGLRVALSDGAGGFHPVQPVSAGQATFAVTAGDVDEDGAPDLLSADRYSMAVTVHRNPGNGVFPVLGPVFEATSLNIRMDVGDVDGDGDLDVFTSTESTGRKGSLLRNLGEGVFAAPVFYTHSETYGRGAGRAKLRDLNGDGHLDLLYNDPHTDFHNGYDFHTALNDGAGTFGPIIEWTLGTGGNGDVDAFDLDNDGDLDVVNCEELCCAPGGEANRLFISRNRGDGTFDPPYTIFISRGPHALLGGDFNEDGNVDLVTTHWMPYGERDFINVHLGNGDGTLREEVIYPVGQGPRWIVSDDFNRDGHADLATGNSGADNEGRETLTVLFGTGAGTFGSRADYYAPFSPDLLGATGLAAGDIDDDGDIDLMMTTVANGVAVYANDGTGAFAVRPRLGLTYDPWSLHFTDVTGDGLRDLVMVSSLPDDISGSIKGVAVLPGGAPVSSGPELGNRGGRGLTRLSLSSPHPNPVRDAASFSVTLVEEGRVRIDLFDAAGRHVQGLHDGVLGAGIPHGFQLRGGGLASGMYYLRVSGATDAATRPVVIVR